MKWKKDIAYLKDIDAYDYRDNGMISILLVSVSEEVHKEIVMKCATAGSNAIDPSHRRARGREDH